MSTVMLKRIAFIALLWVWLIVPGRDGASIAHADECYIQSCTSWCHVNGCGDYAVFVMCGWWNQCTGESDPNSVPTEYCAYEESCGPMPGGGEPPPGGGGGPPQCYNNGAICSSHGECCSGVCSWLHGGMCMSCWEYCQGDPNCTCP